MNSGRQHHRDLDQDQHETDLIWGINPVLELLRNAPRRLHEISLLEKKGGPRIGEILRLAKEAGVKTRFVPTLRIPGRENRIAHQGVVARLLPFPTLDLDSLLEEIRPGMEASTLLALDSIQDPQNLGAIVRSAVAAGVAGILLPRDRSAPLSGTAAKAAAGTLAMMRVAQVTNLGRALQQLKQEGFWIYGAAGDAPNTLYETEFSGPVCLVIGGEEKGIRPLVRQECDHLLAIPMSGGVNSLNASVAAGVMLFEIKRQRGRQEGSR